METQTDPVTLARARVDNLRRENAPKDEIAMAQRILEETKRAQREQRSADVRAQAAAAGTSGTPSTPPRPPTTRNVDPAVAKARSDLANACRRNDPEAIAAARAALDEAKKDRVRRDAQAIIDGSPSAPGELRVTGTSGYRVSREDHDILFRGQVQEVDEFKAANGNPRLWDDLTRALWDAMISRQRRSHIALGCSATAPCTGSFNRG